jgi:hypothetical protein
MLGIIVLWMFHDMWNYFIPKKVCRDFKSQSQAQKYFEKDKVEYRNLDGNNDGQACNSYRYEN